MHNLIYALLPETLMVQATYFDGLLYLPAYELAAQLLRLSLPLAMIAVAAFLLVCLGLLYLVLRLRAVRCPS